MKPIRFALRTLRAASLAICATSSPLAAENSLVADHVHATPTTLTARGDVIVFLDEIRVTARGLTYDRATGKIKLIGPVTIRTSSGDILRAEAGDLDPRHEEGVFEKLQILIENHIQITAARGRRDGNLYGLSQAALTSCQTCPGQAPLWELRSSKITYDRDARRIWLAPGSFAIRGQPIAPTPAFSLPANGVKRAQGWLLPTLERSNGAAIAKLRYFWPIDDHSDLTISPRIGQRQSVELRYRQGFALGPAQGRLALTAHTAGRAGSWANFYTAITLPHHWRLNAQWETTDSADFLRDYRDDTRSKLQNFVRLEQVLPRSLTKFAIRDFTPLRDTLAARRIIYRYAHAQINMRRAAFGGFAYARVDGDGVARDIDALRNGDFAQNHISATLGWRGRYIIGPGFELGMDAGIQGGAYTTQIKDISGKIQENGTWRAAYGKTSLAWPLAMDTGTIHHIVTPKVSLIWAHAQGDTPKAFDSSPAIWDEIALHSIDPLPGQDRQYDGARAAFSLGWSAQDQTGRHYQAQIGRSLPVWKNDMPRTGAGQTEFDLDEAWIASFATHGAHYDLQTRFVVDDGIAASDTRAALNSAYAGAALRHAYVRQSKTGKPNRDLSHLYSSAWWQVTDQLRLNAQANYDLMLKEPDTAEIGLSWRNECVSVTLSASHSFENSIRNEAENDFGFNISLDGFSAGSSYGPARSCRK